jgi:hypothetical protein
MAIWVIRKEYRNLAKGSGSKWNLIKVPLVINNDILIMSKLGILVFVSEEPKKIKQYKVKPNKLYIVPYIRH